MQPLLQRRMHSGEDSHDLAAVPAVDHEGAMVLGGGPGEGCRKGWLLPRDFRATPVVHMPKSASLQMNQQFCR